jgi:hypothetical protein
MDVQLENPFRDLFWDTGDKRRILHAYHTMRNVGQI